METYETKDIEKTNEKPLEVPKKHEMIIYHSLTIHVWYIFTIKKRTINVGKYTVRPMDDKLSHFSDPQIRKGVFRFGSPVATGAQLEH